MNRQEYFEEFKAGYELGSYLRTATDAIGYIRNDHTDAVVAFSSIKGFAEYVELTNSIQACRFLEDYQQIYASAILKTQWAFANVEQDNILEITPRVCKFVGTKVMLVWEFPRQPERLQEIDGEHFLSRLVFNILVFIQGYFQLLLRSNESVEKYSQHVEKLKLSIGVFRSSCYRQTSYGNKVINYIGKAVDYAIYLSRVHDRGITASLNFIDKADLPIHRLREIGQIVYLDGDSEISEQIRVWKSNKRRVNPLAVLDGGRNVICGLDCNEVLPWVPDNLLRRRKDGAFFAIPSRETEDSFDYIGLRQAVEITTARNLARMMSNDQQTDLTSLNHAFDTMTEAHEQRDADAFVERGDAFHRAIANLATHADVRAAELIHNLWSHTAHQIEGIDRVHPEYILSQYASEVIDEHRAIFLAISEGNEDDAEKAVIDHMTNQRRRKNL